MIPHGYIITDSGAFNAIMAILDNTSVLDPGPKEALIGDNFASFTDTAAAIELSMSVF